MPKAKARLSPSLSKALVRRIIIIQIKVYAKPVIINALIPQGGMRQHVNVTNVKWNTVA